MTTLLTYRGAVYTWHCDHLGHMNNMWYAGKFDEACWQLLSMLGLTPTRFAQDGTGMAAVEQHIQYKRELKAGDVITVRSEVLEFAGKKIRFRHEMVNGETGEVAAVTTLLGIHMDSVARKACDFPGELLAQSSKTT